ncbi:hypothetical protein KAR91_25540 [Candidatus Pacearchaeota archaeon]|nr:hypothetical protein [Candidatus Pacearchaeota archaeon]
MKRIIYLNTARVYAHKADGSPKIERSIVKLEDGPIFSKFVKHIHLKGFIENEPPYVSKVVEASIVAGIEKLKEVDPGKWQKIVEVAQAKHKPDVAIDYKKLSENQANEIEQLNVQNAGFEERLKALEKGNKKSGNREALETKAKLLSIKFRDNIGDTKLLEKIQAIEPDFKL